MASHVIDTARSPSASTTFATLRLRFTTWRQERARKARVARELATYTDRELFDLGISRANIPEIIAGTFRR